MQGARTKPSWRRGCRKNRNRRKCRQLRGGKYYRKDKERKRKHGKGKKNKKGYHQKYITKAQKASYRHQLTTQSGKAGQLSFSLPPIQGKTSKLTAASPQIAAPHHDTASDGIAGNNAVMLTSIGVFTVSISAIVLAAAMIAVLYYLFKKYKGDNHEYTGDAENGQQEPLKEVSISTNEVGNNYYGNKYYHQKGNNRSQNIYEPAPTVDATAGEKSNERIYHLGGGLDGVDLPDCQGQEVKPFLCEGQDEEGEN